MNRYTLIDFKNNIIYDLEKVEIDFEENKEQTSSVFCEDKKDLIEELKEIIKYLESELK
jgi:hypothetical protein